MFFNLLNTLLCAFKSLKTCPQSSSLEVTKLQTQGHSTLTAFAFYRICQKKKKRTQLLIKREKLASNSSSVSLLILFQL